MWFRKLIAPVFAALCVVASEGASQVTAPRIPEEVAPIKELRVSDHAYAAVRKPLGEGPFPAVIFLHGGLGHSSMEALRRSALQQPAASRFLAWGYVTVTATRRAIEHDPGDRGVVDDTLALIEAVEKLGYVGARSVALYGGSGGGTLALELASVRGLAAVVAGEPATIIYMGMFDERHVIRDAAGKPTGDRRGEVMSADPKSLYTDELKNHTRHKLGGLNSPVLILHGDQHPLRKFNLGLFVPEMQAMGKDVTVKTYPGEPHGFYWGQGKDPAMALRANQDAEAFIRKRVAVQPKPISEGLYETVPVSPRARPE